MKLSADAEFFQIRHLLSGSFFKNCAIFYELSDFS